jgi:cathepsin B
MPVDPKAAAKAAAKHGKKPKNTTLQYYLWIGGAVAALVGAMLLLILNPDKGPFGIPVNDDGLITHVNRNAKTWKADKSSMFTGWSLGDAKALEGISVSGQSQPCVVPDTQVPDSFDAREKWPQCFNQPIYSMGNCTASWAVATASALSSRFCISSPSEYADLMLSPQQLLSCDSANRACSGGDVDAVWGYIEREGLVNESCFPYQGDGTISCQSKCSDGASLRAASHCHLNNEAAIRKEVFLNGPVVAPIFLMDDFLVYSSGLYQEMPTATQLSAANRQRLIHMVKIVGWGSMEGKSYWLIENSWGPDWGEGGYAKILAGGDPQSREGIIVETYVLAGTPASGKLGDDADDDIDLEDIDLDLDDDSGEDE